MKFYSTIKELVIETYAAEGGMPSYEKLTALVREHFPNSRWKKSHYAWYKSKIKLGAIQVPGISGLRSIATEVPTVIFDPPVREVAPDQRKLQNRYRIIGKLGAGGMGSVYEAVDERLKCLVAVKQMSTDLNLRGRDFEREASLLANLSHPALPRVSDHFLEDNGQFLVMQHVPGDDLQQSLEKRGAPFPVSDVLDWANQLLDVLEYLHEKEPPIIHRDIKPSNIKIVERGRVMLLDFGLAKGALGQMETLTRTRSILGFTLIYAPFEQMFGEGTDPKSDIYALGATLYHLITGTKPIAATVRFEAVENDQPDPLPTVHQLNSSVPSRISDVIDHAMAIRKKNRLQSASAMRDALRGKVVAPSPSRRRRWDEPSFFSDASNRRLSPDHIAALHSLLDWSKVHADNIRFGTGADSGSFSAIFSAVSPTKSIFTGRSNGSVWINFAWLNESETAKAFRERFGHSLEQNGFTIPTRFVERYVSLQDKEWVSRLDDFLRTLEQELENVKATGPGGERQWDEESVVKTIEYKRGTAEAEVARKLIDWSKAHASHVNWGKGANDGSFCPVFERGSGYPFIPFRVYTYGSVEILFNRMSVPQNAPFDVPEKRLEVLRQLNEIPGISLPNDGINRRPAVQLASLTNPKSLTMFLRTIEQAVAHIKVASNYV